jgi:putative endonuclease
MPVLSEGEFGVYMLLCDDKNFYIGYSSNIYDRLNRHVKGEASKHTRKHRPIKLVYCEVYPEEKLAIQRERQLKGWSRKKKSLLIAEKVKDI